MGDAGGHSGMYSFTVVRAVPVFVKSAHDTVRFDDWRREVPPPPSPDGFDSAALSLGKGAPLVLWLLLVSELSPSFDEDRWASSSSAAVVVATWYCSIPPIIVVSWNLTDRSPVGGGGWTSTSNGEGCLRGKGDGC